MTLRLLWLAALATLALGFAASTLPVKGGGCIDPNGGDCRPGSGSAAGADRGAGIDPNG